MQNYNENHPRILPPRGLWWGNLILDCPRFKTSFVITASKHLFCPRVCQEGKQTPRSTDEYSNVRSLPVGLSRCKSLPEKLLGPNRLVVSLRKQLRRTFVFLPVSEAFSERAAALSGDTEEQSGAWYRNSFQFQIWTVSFVDNPLKHEGCNLLCTGVGKKVSCWHVCLSLCEPYCREKLLLVIWKRTAGAPQLRKTITPEPVSTLCSSSFPSRPVPTTGHMSTFPRRPPSVKTSSAAKKRLHVFCCFFFALLQNIDPITQVNMFAHFQCQNDNLSQSQFQSKTQVQSDISQSKCHVFSWLNTCAHFPLSLPSHFLQWLIQKVEYLSLMCNYMCSVPTVPTLVNIADNFRAPVEL